ncbi:hypothetical protein YC2023_090201 [Brassica napus]
MYVLIAHRLDRLLPNVSVLKNKRYNTKLKLLALLVLTSSAVLCGVADEKSFKGMKSDCSLATPQDPLRISTELRSIRFRAFFECHGSFSLWLIELPEETVGKAEKPNSDSMMVKGELGTNRKFASHGFEFRQKLNSHLLGQARHEIITIGPVLDLVGKNMYLPINLRVAQELKLLSSRRKLVKAPNPIPPANS